METEETPLYGAIPDYRYRLVEDVGDGFLLGATVGSAFHFTKGLTNSTKHGRVTGGIRAVRANLPRVAGSCGGYMALFCALDGAMSVARGRREDHWNSIVAGAATFGLGNARRGAPAAALFALLGAASFAGLAGLWWTLEWRHSRLSRELRMKRGDGTHHPKPVGSCGSDHWFQRVED